MGRRERGREGREGEREGGGRGGGGRGGERGAREREGGGREGGGRGGETREEKSKGTYLAHFGLPLPQSAQNSLPEMEYSSLEIFTRLLGFLRSRHNPNYPKDQKTS